jgi:hypothetical protein
MKWDLRNHQLFKHFQLRDLRIQKIKSWLSKQLMAQVRLEHFSSQVL